MRYCGLFGLLVCLASSPALSAPKYGKTGQDVSYQSVESLPFEPADAKLHYGEDALQFGLLWLPERAADPVIPPLVVLIHGGCWLNAYDIQHTFALSTALAQDGYAVWSLEYRRLGDAGGGWPGSLEDVRKGLAYVEKLARYPVDTGRVVVAGHSAGGHLALLAGDTVAQASAVIGLAAITDLIAYAQGDNSCQTAVPQFMAGSPEDSREQYRAASPAEQDSLHGNIILMHGSADAIVPPRQAELPGASTVMVDGGGHFDWVHPGTGSFRAFLQVLQGVFGE